MIVTEDATLDGIFREGLREWCLSSGDFPGESEDLAQAEGPITSWSLFEEKGGAVGDEVDRGLGRY